MLFPDQADFNAEILMGYDEDDSFCCSQMDIDESDEEDSLSSQSFNEDMFFDTQKDATDVVGGKKRKVPHTSKSSLASHLITALQEEETTTTAMDLSFPIVDEKDFRSLLEAIRSNDSVTECRVSNRCFQSLPVSQRRELAVALGDLPSLKCLNLDSVFAEFLYTQNFCRCWKRDQYYHQHKRVSQFQNRTIEALQLTKIPADISEAVLGNLVMMAVSNFASLKRLDMSFESEFDGPQEALMRVALTALSHSKSLQDVKLGFEDDFSGDFNLIMEVDATRSENIMRVLKLRCGDVNLCDRSYAELSEMLKINSRTLQGLVLDTAVDNAMVLSSALGQNSNLKALCLGTFDCQEKASKDGLLSLVSQVLCPKKGRGCEGSSLDYLSLVCQEMDDQGVEQLSKTFAQSSLQELMLFLDNETDGSISTQGIASLAKMLQVNETIEDFSLICHSLDDDGLMAFAKALQVNDGTLRKLKLRCSKALEVSPKGYQAFIDMLQTNTTLESFELSRCPDSGENNDDDIDCESTEEAHVKYQHEIEYYLNLNKSGARDCQLNIDATPKEFCTLLVSQRNDLNTLYYMLSSNPSFVAFGT